MSKTVAIEQIDSERLTRIKRNRQIQLQRWIYLEKEYLKKHQNGIKHKTKRIVFDRDTVLLEAISRNDIKEAKELLEAGVDPNAATVDGLTGLHQCAIDNFIDMAVLLLNYKANPNAVDLDRWTPLHAAATCNNAPMFILFCQHGADMLALNADGEMPYEICQDTKVLNIIENEMNKKGITQQMIDNIRMVPEQKMLQDVKLFAKSKGHLNELDNQGAALIHVACCNGYCDVVQFLLENGANISLPDKDGWLPIHLAACWSHVDVVELLVVFGANIEAQNSSGDTIFDLCQHEVRERLFYIKDHIASIRKNYNFTRLPSNKSFRHSRGSSVRRTSVRQKNMLAKKEAKGEFIALTQTMATSQDNSSTIDEGSDADSSENHLQAGKVTVHSLKSENQYNKQKTSHPDPNNSSKPPLVVTANQSPKTVPNSTTVTIVKPESLTTAALEPKLQDTNRNHKSDANETTVVVANPDKTLLPSRRLSSENTKTTSDVEGLDKPYYVFSSSTENWDTSKEQKLSRRRKCCSII